MTLGQVYLPLLQFYPISIIPPMLYTHLHLHLILPKGQIFEVWEPSKKRYSFGNRVTLDTNNFFIFQELMVARVILSRDSIYLELFATFFTDKGDMSRDILEHSRSYHSSFTRTIILSTLYYPVFNTVNYNQQLPASACHLHKATFRQTLFKLFLRAGPERTLGIRQAKAQDIRDFRHYEGGRVVTLTNRPSLSPGVIFIG